MKEKRGKNNNRKKTFSFPELLIFHPWNVKNVNSD